MKNKLKILAAGDIHGDTRLVKKLALKAKKENIDLVILCGDITFADQIPSNLINPFIEENKKVLFVPGNHDSFATADFLVNFYGIKNIHGYGLEYQGIGFFGCGGANIGLTQLTEKQIFETLSKSFKSIKSSKKKIMITHIHPSESKIEKLTSFFPGSKAVKKAIEKFKPDILLCSHVHEAEGIEEKIGKTRVINVGREGKIIEI